MQPYLSASLPGVSAAIRKAIYDASNWEDLHFPVKPGMAVKPGMSRQRVREFWWKDCARPDGASGAIRVVIGLLALVAPRPIVRG
jgi:hypothetical protein